MSLAIRTCVDCWMMTLVNQVTFLVNTFVSRYSINASVMSSEIIMSSFLLCVSVWFTHFVKNKYKEVRLVIVKDDIIHLIYFIPQHMWVFYRTYNEFVDWEWNEIVTKVTFYFMNLLTMKLEIANCMDLTIFERCLSLHYWVNVG